jgi:hypothetical protein
VQQYLITLECLWFSVEAHFYLDGFLNKQNTRHWASGNAQRVVEISLRTAKHTVWCAVSKQGLVGYIFVEGSITNQRYLQKLKNEVILVIQGAGNVDITYLQQDGERPHTGNVVLHVLHGCVWQPCAV